MAATGLLNPSHVIYALSVDGKAHRYVGFTAKKIRQRLAMHRWEAKHDNPSPLYDWFRKEGPDDVTATVLEKLSTDATRDLLGQREKFWVGHLRDEGYDLLNRTDGGLGMPGHQWTAEERAAISGRVKLQDISHLWTAEAQEKRRQSHIGIKHKPHVFADPEGHAETGRWNAHKRWHVGRDITKDDCTFCST